MMFIHKFAVHFDTNTHNLFSINTLEYSLTMTPGSSEQSLASYCAPDPRKLTIDDLGQQHRDVFTRAFFNVLSTPAAETTFAQILDGAPLSQSVQNVPGWIYPLDHPIRTQHLELCPEVVDRIRHDRDTFDLMELKFEPRVWNKRLSTHFRSLIYPHLSHILTLC